MWQITVPLFLYDSREYFPRLLSGSAPYEGRFCGASLRLRRCPSDSSAESENETRVPKKASLITHLSLSGHQPIRTSVRWITTTPVTSLLIREEDINFGLHNICHKSTISFFSFNHGRSSKWHVAKRTDFGVRPNLHNHGRGNSPSFPHPTKAVRENSSYSQKSIRLRPRGAILAMRCVWCVRFVDEIHRSNSKKLIRTRNLAIFFFGLRSKHPTQCTVGKNGRKTAIFGSRLIIYD